MKNDKIKKVLNALRVFILLLYPFLIFFALQYNLSLRLLSLLFMGIVLLNYQKTKNKILLIIGILLCCLVYFYKHSLFLKIYPVMMNFSFFLVFVSSLHKKPLITVFAERMKVKMTKRRLLYTRKVTEVWAIFMFVLSIISLATVFMSDFIWMLFNGFISYILIGCLFLIEWIIRKKIKHV